MPNTETVPAISPDTTNPWRWIPSLYFGQGIPYVVVMSLSVILYKNLGFSNTDIALYTSWLYLPWVIKPFWSPVVEMLGTKRRWITSLQAVIGVSLALVALTLPTSYAFQLSLAVFWLMAFSSATHDIAADGFYMLALPEQQQAAFVGVRSTSYRAAMIAGQGGLVALAGYLKDVSGNVTLAWGIVFAVLAVFFTVLAGYHLFALPRPAADQPQALSDHPVRGFIGVFAEFLRKPDIAAILAFLLLYRCGEAQLVKLAAPFLLDASAKGGLGLTTQQVGLVYGTIGVLALTLGGILGGLAISRLGLKRCIWGMVLIGNLPHLAFVYLASALPSSIPLIGGALAIEQFGYGFGFAAYLMVMIMTAAGPHKTAHYAICTGFMALSMMLPGMVSGWLQSQLGYLHFFIWICISIIPTVLVTSQIKIDPEFGKRQR